jgi:hypothetical protein
MIFYRLSADKAGDKRFIRAKLTCRCLLRTGCFGSFSTDPAHIMADILCQLRPVRVRTGVARNM